MFSGNSHSPVLDSNEGNAGALNLNQNCKAYLSTQKEEEEGMTLTHTEFIPFRSRVEEIRERDLTASISDNNSVHRVLWIKHK